MYYTGSNAFATLRQGLVGAWCPSLPNGGSGNTLPDQSGYNNHGTLTNMGPEDWVSGQYGRALDFDGSDDFVTISADSGYQAGSFSFVWWQKRSGNVTQSYPGIITHSILNASSIVVGASALQAVSTDLGIPNKTYFEFNNQTQRSGVAEITAGNDGLWHCYIAVINRNSNTISLYKDSILQESNTTVSAASITRPIEFGRRTNSTTPTSWVYSTTQLDDIRIYNRALTELEIKLLASRPGIGLRQDRDRNTFYQFPSGARRKRILTGMP